MPERAITRKEFARVMEAAYEYGTTKSYGNDNGVAWDLGAKAAIEMFLFFKKDELSEEEIDSWFSGFRTACETYAQIRGADDPRAEANSIVRNSQ
jgi:hypothetical protein